jgi:hypothetical protein
VATGFSVFVNIGGRLNPSLNNAAAGAEQRLTRLSQVAQSRAKSITAAYSKISAGMQGLASVAAGGGLAFGIKHAIGEGSNLAHETQALRNVGLSVNEVADAINAASKAIKNVPTTTLADNLKLFSETRGAFGDTKHALENLEFNQKIASVLKNASGGKALGDAGDMFNQLVRALEIRGTANDPHEYQADVKGLTKAMLFTHMRVNPHEILNFAQQANPAIKFYSRRFLTEVAPSMMQEFGGERAGTRLQALQNVVMGKVRDRAQTAAWLKAGLLDPKKLVGGKGGQPFAWSAGAVKGTDLFMSDPDRWAKEIVLPALEKAGMTPAELTVSDKSAEESDPGLIDRETAKLAKERGLNKQKALELGKSLATMYRNNEANRAAQALLQQQDRLRIEKDANLTRQVHDPEQIYNDNLSNDPKTGWAALAASLGSLQEAMLGPLTSVIAPGLTALAKGIQSLAVSMTENPGLAAGLSAVAVAIAGFTALKLLEIAAGITGLVTALASAGKAASAGTAGAAAAGGLAGAANDNIVAAANDNVKTAAAAAGGSAIGAASVVAAIGAGGAALATAATKIAEGIIKNSPELAKSVIDNAMTSAMSGDFGLGLAIMRETQGAGEKVGKDLKSGIESQDLNASGKKLGETGKAGLESVDFHSAGTAAGNKLLEGFAAAVGSGGFGVHQKVDGARAAGGPVSAGKSYLVGEKGPELVKFGKDGMVHSAKDTAALLSKRGRNLDAIIKAEGTAKGGRNPYDTALGYGKYGTPDRPLSEMTLKEAYDFGRTVLKRHGKSSALGAFQIVGKTMKDHMQRTGLGWNDLFSPENQRTLADSIWDKQGTKAWGGFKHNRAALAEARGGTSVPTLTAPDPYDARFPLPRRQHAAGSDAPKVEAPAPPTPPARPAGMGAKAVDGAADSAARKVGAHARRSIARIEAAGRDGAGRGAPKVAARHAAGGDGAPAPKIDARAVASTESSKSTTARDGNIYITINVTASGAADGNDIARRVKTEVASVVRRLQSEQRGLLSD